MANPMYSMFGANQPPMSMPQQLSGPFGNAAQVANKYQEFMSTFSGNPQQIAQNMMATGQMTQEQFRVLDSMVRPTQQLLRQMGMRV